MTNFKLFINCQDSRGFYIPTSVCLFRRSIVFAPAPTTPITSPHRRFRLYINLNEKEHICIYNTYKYLSVGHQLGRRCPSIEIYGQYIKIETTLA
jgi:hypothetical protein